MNPNQLDNAQTVISFLPHLKFPPANALEALAVNNTGTRFVVLSLRAPQVLEGGKGSQDGSTDPDRVLPLGWSNDLDLISITMSSHGSDVIG